jgi:hypothetical protein
VEEEHCFSTRRSPDVEDSSVGSRTEVIASTGTVIPSFPLCALASSRKVSWAFPEPTSALTPKPWSRLHRFGCSSPVQTFFVVLFASLGLSLTIYSGFHRLWYPRRPMAANSVLSRFTSKPPLVDRTILEKIAGLDPEDEPDSGTDFSIPINVNSIHIPSLHSFRPPRVTRMPEVQPQAPPNLEMETQNRFCSEGSADRIPPPCKFLLPLRIAEQGLNAHAFIWRSYWNLLERSTGRWSCRTLERTGWEPVVDGVSAFTTMSRRCQTKRWRFQRLSSDKIGSEPGSILSHLLPHHNSFL